MLFKTRLAESALLLFRILRYLLGNLLFIAGYVLENCSIYWHDLRASWERKFPNHPRPLPYHRQFNLSEIALPANTAATSPLLRLPYEIRLQIYSYLLSDRYYIHLDLDPSGRRFVEFHRFHLDRSSAIRNVREQNSNTVNDGRIFPFRKPILTTELDCDDRNVYVTQEPLPCQTIGTHLMRTCRQLYQECTPLLYSTNTFCIWNLDHLIYLSQTIRPQRLASIRSLQLVLHVSRKAPTVYVIYNSFATWKQAWKMIAKQMTGLRKLYLVLEFTNTSYEDERLCFLPLVEQVRGLSRLSLWISHYEESNSGAASANVRPPDELRRYRTEVTEKVCLPRTEEFNKRRGKAWRPQWWRTSTKVIDAIDLVDV